MADRCVIFEFSGSWMLAVVLCFLLLCGVSSNGNGEPTLTFIVFPDSQLTLGPSSKLDFELEVILVEDPKTEVTNVTQNFKLVKLDGVEANGVSLTCENNCNGCGCDINDRSRLKFNVEFKKSDVIHSSELKLKLAVAVEDKSGIRWRVVQPDLIINVKDVRCEYATIFCLVCEVGVCVCVYYASCLEEAIEEQTCTHISP